MLKTIYSIISLQILFSCSTPDSTKSNNTNNNSEPKIEGVYKLIALQEQNDTLFVPYEGVTIYKFFADGNWNSPALRIRNKQVINMAGGTYVFNSDTLTERLGYHLKDTNSIGELTKYKVEFMGDTLYQSGVYKKGTSDEWKIEEYWIRF